MHVERFAHQNVRRFLRSRFSDDVEDVMAVGHGEWSKAYTFRQGGGEGEYVIRFSTLDEDFRKDELAMSFASADLPVPKLVEVGEAFDGFYAISERAHGEFIEALDEAGIRQVLPSLFAAFDAMRAVDLSRTSGYGVWNGHGAAPHASWRSALLDVAEDLPVKRTYGFRERLRASPVAERTFGVGIEQMKAVVDACPENRHLLHSDLLYFNVLVSDGRVSMLLDWGSAMFGDFLWDLAWLTFWQPYYTAWSSVDIRAAAVRHFAEIGLAVPNFEERMRCYELCIGLDGMAYQAFRGHLSDLEWTTNRMLGLTG